MRSTKREYVFLFQVIFTVSDFLLTQVFRIGIPYTTTLLEACVNRNYTSYHVTLLFRDVEVKN